MTVRTEHSRGVTRLIIDRPERRNALDASVVDGLVEGVTIAEGDAQCRVLVVTGEGDHFCAGRDFGEADRTMPLDRILDYDDRYAALFARLHRMTKPSVAVVRGYAVAGGFAIAMACDFMLADASARFGAFEMRGGVPAAMNAAVLTHMVGKRRALELLMSTEPVTAEALHAMQLVNRLAPDAASLKEVARSFVGNLAALDPVAVKLTKETHRAVAGMPYEDSLILARTLNALMISSGRIEDAAATLARSRSTRNA